MRFDVHAHACSEALLDRWTRDGVHGLHREGDDVRHSYGALEPQVYRQEERFARMAEIGIDVQLISPVPNFTAWEGGAADAELARELNRSTADCVAESGGRFEGLATLTLGDPKGAVEELKRALAEHGFVGAFIATYAGDRPLDDPSLDPLFAELGRLEIPVFMHPMSAEPTPRWNRYTLTTAINWPNETTLAISRLIFAGALERNPGLNLILAHGGGTLPFLRGRLDLAYEAPKYEYNAECRANISKRPSEYLDRLYFDTAVASPESLHFLIDLVGPGRVIFGTDDPFEIADTGGTMALPALQERDEDEREQILGGTVERLLGR
jgi:aminocarboxymuconate-semialdehyde decarboxylase